MRRKIFTSNESRIRLNLELTSRDWWLRSSDAYLSKGIGCVNASGYISYYNSYYDIGVLLTCMI